jgi:hypothetical protein
LNPRPLGHEPSSLTTRPWLRAFILNIDLDIIIQNNTIFCLVHILETQDTSSYIKKVQFLLMYMFQREQIFSKTDVAKYTTQAAEKMFDLDLKTFFWTKHQKALIFSNPKRVIFTSAFGTGKTTLLKEKAKKLGESKQIESSFAKILFVVFLGKDALLTQALKWELGELQEHVEIISLTGKIDFFDLTEMIILLIKSFYF